MEPFHFDRPHLLALAERRKQDFAQADPFPHVVIDNLLPAEALLAVLEEFPEMGATGWRRWDEVNERKMGLSDEACMGPVTRHLLHEFNSQVFMQFLEVLTGIAGLIPDPYFVGGGLHQIVPGGFLKVHADFNRHKGLGLERRLNLLLYLNEDWHDSYGGHLELWDRSMLGCRERIAPTFNRCVIFATRATSYHGHPEPLACPQGRSRRSLALYYYTADVGAREPEHTTRYQARPGEQLEGRITARGVAERLLPPVVMDAARSARRRLGVPRK